MGYVTVTESVGEVMKTYHFESYDDFKDWENKLTGVLVSDEEQFVPDTEGWIKNNGLKPNLRDDTMVQVKFKDGLTAEGAVGYWAWSLAPDFCEVDIDFYRVIKK